jgi:polysaccharide deacetylase family protein (PEP-CTERM system associated)
MGMVRAGLPVANRAASLSGTKRKGGLRIILSFDVEEHHRIEEANGTIVSSALQSHYWTRLEVSTRWLVDTLAERDLRATFFVVGQVAEHCPGLIRAIHRAGHELASHGWDHRRIHHFTPASFAAELRQSRDILEQITGEAVVGYRAPTFSLERQTAWAIDVLAEQGLVYDSSIYPVWHDRYGVPRAPRSPFLVRGARQAIVELPPATLGWLGARLPVGGGGYFRLLPLFFVEEAIYQLHSDPGHRVAMLYFHPWEFDPRQTRLPLKLLSRLRTYVGIHRSRARLLRFLERHAACPFACARDVARGLDAATLPIYDLPADAPVLSSPKS